MLTDAQYKALKAWDDNLHASLARMGSGKNLSEVLMIYHEGRYQKLCNRKTVLILKKIGLVTTETLKVSGAWVCRFQKIQPACDDAIREYEEAHNIN